MPSKDDLPTSPTPRTATIDVPAGGDFNDVGAEILIDGIGCRRDILSAPHLVEEALRKAVARSNATMIDLTVHAFSPHGVTATATLAESHITIHTWPELGYFAANIFMCGRPDRQAAAEVLISALNPLQVSCRTLRRGQEIARANTASHPASNDS